MTSLATLENREFRYSITTTATENGDVSELRLSALGVTLYDFNREGVHRKDYNADTVIESRSQHSKAALRDNDEDWLLAGSEKYFNPKNPLHARDLLGKNMEVLARSIFRYTYAIEEVLSGTYSTSSGIRAVDEAQKLGWDAEIVPEKIRALAEQGYLELVSQAKQEVSAGHFELAAKHMLIVQNGLDYLDFDFDIDLAIADLDSSAEQYAKSTFLFKSKRQQALLAEWDEQSQGLRPATDAIDESAFVMIGN